MDISVIVPLYNEEESLIKLYEWIEQVMASNKFSFEVIFINDGSTDRSWQIIESLQQKSSNVRGIKFRNNYGKSPALYCGFRAAQGDVVITMDADLQDSPDEIPGLYRMIKDENYDLVSGWKKKRYDSKLTKNLPSKLYNATARKVTGLKLHDMNCGLKAYRSDVIKNIEESNGLEVRGWKGGDFTLFMNDVIYIANQGESNNAITVVDIEELPDVVILHTEPDMY